MKRFMLAALTVAMVAINPAASADSGSNGGGRGGGGGSYHGGGNHGGGNGGGSYNGGGNRGGSGSYHGGGNNHGGGGSYHGGGDYHGGGGKYYGGYYGPPPKSAYPSQKAYRQARFNYPPYPAPYYRPYYKGYYPYARPYYGRPNYPVGYPAYYGYPTYYGNHHNNNNNSDWPAYLIGGAVLGSVLTNVYQNSQAQQVPAQQVVVAPQQGRRLLRDLNGNCYDRSTDANGNELRTELPPSACNW